MTDLLRDAEPLADPVAAEPDDVAVIMYTSGTTGRPKGAMLTHANIAWNNVNALHAIDLGADEVALVVASLFHIGGLNVTTLLVCQKGGHIVLHRSIDPATAPWQRSACRSTRFARSARPASHRSTPTCCWPPCCSA